MLMDLIGAFTVAVAAAAAVMLLRRHLSFIPRYMAPIAAGFAMLAFTIWSEYSWFSRTKDALPEDVVVTSTHRDTFVYRPWTYLRPYVNRFSAVDLHSLRRNESRPNQVLAEILLITRHRPGVKIPVLVDCSTGRRADIADGMTVRSDGTFEDVQWSDMARDHPLMSALCRQS